MQGVVLSSCIILAGILLLTHLHEAESHSLMNREEMELEDEMPLRVNRDELRDFMNYLTQDDLARRQYLSATKRGLDFGVTRGFSGAEMAKHLMGMMAAKNPWGPGRRKRSLDFSPLTL